MQGPVFLYITVAFMKIRLWKFHQVARWGKGCEGWKGMKRVAIFTAIHRSPSGIWNFGAKSQSQPLRRFQRATNKCIRLDYSSFSLLLRVCRLDHALSVKNFLHIVPFMGSAVSLCWKSLPIPLFSIAVRREVQRRVASATKIDTK